MVSPNTTYRETGEVPPAGLRTTAVKRISWAAVFAGVILAATVQMLLSMLGTGIGMSTIDPVQGESPTAGSFGIGAGIWWIVSSLIALYIGGWIAGHLAGVPTQIDGMLHGLLAWGLSTLLVLYLIGAAISSIVGGVFGMVGSGISAVAPPVAGAAAEKLEDTDIPWERIKREGLKLLRQTGVPGLQPEVLQDKAQGIAGEAKQSAQQAAKQPATTDEEFSALLDRLLRQGKGVASAVDKEAVVNVLVARGMSRQEAERTVTNWQETYQKTRAEAEATARKAADATAEAAAKVSLWGFFGLLLGAIAAALGGMAGRPRTAVLS